MGTAQGAQGVVDGKAARNAQLHPGNLLPGHRLELYPFREEAQVLGGEVGLVPPLRVGEHRTGRFSGVGASRLVIQIQNRRAALPEEAAFGLLVRLHGLVKVQMVLGEVRKRPHGEGDAVHPVEAQRVGGDLHHHMGAAAVRHPAEPALDLPAFRGGALGGADLVAHPVFVGADKPCLRPQCLFDHGF